MKNDLDCLLVKFYVEQKWLLPKIPGDKKNSELQKKLRKIRLKLRLKLDETALGKVRPDIVDTGKEREFSDVVLGERFLEEMEKIGFRICGAYPSKKGMPLQYIEIVELKKERAGEEFKTNKQLRKLFNSGWNFVHYWKNPPEPKITEEELKEMLKKGMSEEEIIEEKIKGKIQRTDTLNLTCRESPSRSKRFRQLLPKDFGISH